VQAADGAAFEVGALALAPSALAAGSGAALAAAGARLADQTAGGGDLPAPEPGQQSTQHPTGQQAPGTAAGGSPEAPDDGFETVSIHDERPF
jgi:hypothetical protein